MTQSPTRNGLTILAILAILVMSAGFVGKPLSDAQAQQSVSAKVDQHIESLKLGSVKARAAAAEALWEIGAEANAAVPILIEALKDEASIVRRPAAEALGRIGADARAAVPALIEALKDEDGGDLAAAQALGKIGADAKAAVPALKAALKSETDYVRGAAYEALRQITGNDYER